MYYAKQNARVVTLLLSVTLVLITAAINPSLVGTSAAIIIVALLWLGNREKHVVNPYFLFLLTPISILLYSNSVSPVFLPPLDTNTQLIISAGLFSYLAGLLTIGGNRLKNTPKYSPDYSYYVILILGLTPHVIGVASTGLPVFADNLNAARQTYLLPVIGQLFVFLPVTILIAFRKGQRGKVLVSTTLSFFFAFVMASKFQILFAGLFFFYGYFRYDGKSLLKVPPAALLILTLVAVPLLFEAIYSLRENNPQNQYFWRTQVSFGSLFLDQNADYTYLPYLYLTTPWSNFSYLLELDTQYTYGARSLYSISSVLQLDSALSFDDPAIRRPPFNTHAFLGDFFLDFGVFGVVALSYLLGILVKWCYLVARATTDLLREAIWISIAFASFMLFFSNHFTGQSYPLVSLILFNFYRFLSGILRHRPS